MGLSEERLEQIEQLLGVYQPGEWPFAVGNRKLVLEASHELLAAFNQARQQLDTAVKMRNHCARTLDATQAVVDNAEADGFRRGVEAAIGVIDHWLGHGEACGCWGSQNETELRRLVAAIERLLPPQATAPDERQKTLPTIQEMRGLWQADMSTEEFIRNVRNPAPDEGETRGEGKSDT